MIPYGSLWSRMVPYGPLWYIHMNVSKLQLEWTGPPPSSPVSSTELFLSDISGLRNNA